MIPFIRSFRTGKANNEEAIRKGFNSVRGRSKGVRMIGKGVYGNFLDNGIYSIPWLNDDNMGMYICQNSSHCTLKFPAFYCI